MAKRLKIEYDSENDLLWLHDGRKVKDSLQMDNFVVDFANNGDVSGIEILEASQLLNRISPVPIGKEGLKNIKSAFLKTHRERELLYMIFLIKIVVRGDIMSIPIQLNTPRAVMMVRS